MMSAFRLSALLLFGLTTPSAAQVEVRLDPSPPRAGQAVSATVQFDEVRPTEVTVFVRPVGTRPYDSFAASDQGGGLWRSDLPFDMPPQGVEAYIAYVVEGVTVTEPLEDPEAFPFRSPALHLVATSDIPQRARRHQMISVPLELGEGNDDPIVQLGDDFGEGGDASRWRLLRWDPRALRYRDAAESPSTFDRTRPGRGYWLITSRIGTYDVEGGISAGVVFDGDAPFASPVDVPLRTGWNQIGNPFLFPVAWDDVERPPDVEDPVAFHGSYVPAGASLRPWEGYFVFNPGPDTFLRFRALPPLGREVQLTGDRWLDRAGTGAALLTLTAQSGDARDAVRLGLADAPQAGRPLQLRKPPAIDGGLRLSVQAGDEDWLTRVQPRDTPVWTLALAARGDVTLRLDAEGPWPAGTTVRDLDRGVELAVSNGSAVVPALRGVAVRQLELRAGEATPQPADAVFGRPWPNPSAGAVTVPYTLPVAGPVRLTVVDVLGRTVRVLHDGEQAAGPHRPVWDGRDAGNQPVAPGTYLLRLDAGRSSATTSVTRL